MSIEGPYHHERDRVSWSDADRQWRKQWIKDQILHPDEPRRVPELEKATRNPIRRFFAVPSAMLYRFLEPKVVSLKLLFFFYKFYVLIISLI